MNGSTDRPTDKTHIEERALYWFALMRSDTRTEDDCAAYKTWLNANLAHRRAYRQLEELWGVVGDFADSPAVHEACSQARRFNPQAVHHLNRHPDNRVQEQQPEAVAEPRRRRWLPAALAASLLFVFLGANITGDAPWNPGVYQTAVGEQKSVTLEDGSTLVLDTQTRVAVRYSPEERRIVLERGQARFDVAHNKARPFVVEAGGGMITALGTAFVVRRVVRTATGPEADNGGADEVLVTLLEGKVAVARQEAAIPAPSADRGPEVSPGQPEDPAPLPAAESVVTLEAGQQVVYNSAQGPVSPATEVDLEQATAWQAGRLVFEDHALAEVVADLNRYSRTRILLGNDTLETIKITGVFKTGDNQKVVQTLKTYFDIRVTSDSNGNLILTPAG